MRPALRALLIWLATMAAGLLLASQARFTADMSFFLPAHPTPEQQVLVDQIREGAVTRLLMAGIAGGDAAQRAGLSRALQTRLAALPDFVSVQNGTQESLDVDRDLLLAHRYALSPAVSAERFTVDGLKAAISDSIDLLASPLGDLFKPFLTRDPTGELPALLGQLSLGAQPASSHGVWASRDGQRAMLLAQTRALGSDTDGQATALALIEQTFAELAPQYGSDLRLAVSGPGKFAVDARATIKSEIRRLTLISTLAIFAVLFAVYRSPKLILLSLLPMLSGVLAGVVAVALVYGTVFGITVGFGAALIGEAVDYSTYYFVQSGRHGVDAWRQRFWPTIRLGVLTSVFGFAALLFSGFPGLAQLGLYSIAGVGAAALVARYLLPDLAGPLPPAIAERRLIDPARIENLQRWRWPVLGLALAAAVYLASEYKTLWQANLSALSTVSEADARLDGELRADLGAADSRYFVVVQGVDRERVLQAAERAAGRLDRLVADGTIGSYDTPTRFLPSLATQTARRAALPARDELAHRLAAATAGLPLPADRLTAFLDDVDEARRAAPIDRPTLQGSHLALAVDALMLEHGQGWSALLPLHPPPGDDLAIPVAAVRAALAGSDALFVDMKGEFDALYAGYLDEAIVLSLLGIAAVLLTLATTLRSPRRLVTVALPLALAVLFVVAGLHLLGTRLHLLHLIGLLLIVAVGSNYSLFFDLAEDGRPDAGTLNSTLIATLTTAIGFGTLGLSSVPVLEAVGVTVGPGALIVLLLSAVFVPRRKTCR
ncbi:MMPL family transporter [Azonexus sp. R2A61]|uniref:MMPL family transporter n=1 Tax=Azonexus sp. R2A61 TaxID=2744443 RepID=UPI001F22AEF0|nr:MMPL family transporter [Azonexus sp. R2A61]